jgi:hypothetical protein
MGEAAAGEDGPPAEVEVFSPGFAGGWGDCDFDLESLFVRGKFCPSVLIKGGRFRVQWLGMRSGADQAQERRVHMP